MSTAALIYGGMFKNLVKGVLLPLATSDEIVFSDL